MLGSATMLYAVLIIFSLAVCCSSSDITVKHKEENSKLKNRCLSSYYSPPKCVNHTDGYGCECGSGFHWNTEMCMSTAIDSRLEWKQKVPVRYTLLLGKAFPKLNAFSIAFWIRLFDDKTENSIMSYSYNELTDLIKLVYRGALYIKMYGKEYNTGIRLKLWTWNHMVWTWDHLSGDWQLYLNSSLEITEISIMKEDPIPSGGEFVLGQAARIVSEFNESYAFLGDLAHLNIWNYVMAEDDIRLIHQSCTFMYCGNVVQWAELRRGTRGAMKMRWPSGIIEKSCFTDQEASITCNKYCSYKIGAQCNGEIVKNIVWERTPAIRNISVPCPGQEERKYLNETHDNAVRTCFRTKQNDGNWAEPFIDDCITEELREIKNEFKDILGTETVDEMDILELADNLRNHTESNSYTNPIDVDTVIDLLKMLISTQSQAIAMEVKTWENGKKKYSRAAEVYPTIQQTTVFAQLIINIVENLLSGRHDVGWSATKPQGEEGDKLLQVMELFSSIIAQSLEHHVRDDVSKLKDAKISVTKENIEFKIESQRIDEFEGFEFPGSDDKQVRSDGHIELPPDVTIPSNISDRLFFEISSFRYKDLARYLPNHNLKSRSKEDNVNTPVIALYIHSGDTNVVHNLSTPVSYTLPYLNTFNISNPECVRVRHAFKNGTSTNRWQWLRDDCHIIRKRETEVVCGCYVPGVYAVTTDMYDVNWDKGEKRPILMNVASYFGCAASALMCLTTLILHLKLKTSSSTAALHKNLSVSIMFSQIVFMCGIDRFDFKIMCHCFAVLIHYSVLSTFCWLMNEAFNLYIVITYSAHSHGELTDSGSLLRYYVLGWAMPGVLVGAFVGSQGDFYYAKDMCWIAWDNLWLFVGPVVGIIAVTIMVLIFTAKEHNENSYTKSEKTNNIIMIHMKGLWTQIILITVCWAFAFVSLKMHDSILKYLYAMMNCLQGSFFMVFYLFLHEESFYRSASF
ncbi:hypothetical protein KUTeg_003402 [Tegillarca granosa]|uniref:Uncharacterized protein n=1 Tax=Tegillarca granosa TaxID=220873 RepID=A0ABQ9FQ89_TEGGR|nr:hypothetical protein KUTeg_003402 [Tegillarca granosa]